MSSLIPGNSFHPNYSSFFAWKLHKMFCKQNFLKQHFRYSDSCHRYTFTTANKIRWYEQLLLQNQSPWQGYYKILNLEIRTSLACLCGPKSLNMPSWNTEARKKTQIMFTQINMEFKMFSRWHSFGLCWNLFMLEFVQKDHKI